MNILLNKYFSRIHEIIGDQSLFQSCFKTISMGKLFCFTGLFINHMFVHCLQENTLAFIYIHLHDRAHVAEMFCLFMFFLFFLIMNLGKQQNNFYKYIPKKCLTTDGHVICNVREDTFLIRVLGVCNMYTYYNFLKDFDSIIQTLLEFVKLLLKYFLYFCPT